MSFSKDRMGKIEWERERGGREGERERESEKEGRERERESEQNNLRQMTMAPTSHNLQIECVSITAAFVVPLLQFDT